MHNAKPSLINVNVRIIYFVLRKQLYCNKKKHNKLVNKHLFTSFYIIIHGIIIIKQSVKICVLFWLSSWNLWWQFTAVVISLKILQFVWLSLNSKIPTDVDDDNLVMYCVLQLHILSSCCFHCNFAITMNVNNQPTAGLFWTLDVITPWILPENIKLNGREFILSKNSH